MTPAVSLTPPAAAPKRGDFADWLSPILVKELRQGLQSRVFVSAFVLVQAAMVLFVGLRLISASEDPGNAAYVFESFFTFCVWMPLLVFMPARGLGAIGEETRAQTLDLVQLTRLSAFRIVSGKWLALVAQSCLLASAMLPYAVLRYYFGRVDVMGELVWFATLLVASMVLTAAAVGVSATHVAVRILILMLIVPFMMMYAGSFYFMRGLGLGGGGISFGSLGTTVLWVLPSAALYIFFFLELAAAKIAPAAENHSARKRALALVLAAIIAGAGWLCSKEVLESFVGIFSPILGFVVLEALCETPTQMPGICRVFVMRGFAGRLAGRLLYPGWATGTIFTALVIALVWCGLAGGYRSITGTDLDRQIFSMIGPMLFLALVSPLPVMQLFPRLKMRLWPYLLIQGLSVLMFTIALIIAEAPGGSRTEALNFLAPVPTAALLALLSHAENKDVVQWIFKAAPVADVLLLIWLGVLMVRQFRFIGQMERLSLGDEPAPPEATQPTL